MCEALRFKKQLTVTTFRVQCLHKRFLWEVNHFQNVLGTLMYIDCKVLNLMFGFFLGSLIASHSRRGDAEHDLM